MKRLNTLFFLLWALSLISTKTSAFTPVANFYASDTVLCERDTTIFTDASTGTGITTWAWNFTGGVPSAGFGKGPHSIIFPTAGSYTITLTATNSSGSNTKNKINYILVKAGPLVNLGNDTTIITGNTVTLDAGNAGSTYLWSTGATTQTVNITVSDTVSVIVTNALGCQDEDTMVVKVNTGIDDKEKIPGFTMFPDPVYQVLAMDFKILQSSSITITIMDLLGGVVFQRTTKSYGNDRLMLDLSHLVGGVYLINVYDNVKNQGQYKRFTKL